MICRPSRGGRTVWLDVSWRGGATRVLDMVANKGDGVMLAVQEGFFVVFNALPKTIVSLDALERIYVDRREAATGMPLSLLSRHRRHRWWYSKEKCTWKLQRTASCGTTRGILGHWCCESANRRAQSAAKSLLRFSTTLARLQQNSRKSFVVASAWRAHGAHGARKHACMMHPACAPCHCCTGRYRAIFCRACRRGDG